MSLAHLDGASLIRVKLNGADLRSASLWKATLYAANLERANLESADLRDANLGAANLAGANLHYSTVTRAGFAATLIRYADFRHIAGLTTDMVFRSRDWQLAFYDPNMLKQLGLPADHNKKLEQQMKAGQRDQAAAPPVGLSPK